MALHINGMFRGRRSQDIVHRWEGNPLIGITDLAFKASDIHNAGVVEYQDNLLLLITIENLAGQRSIHLARSVDQGQFAVDTRPFLWPSVDPRYRRHESGGVLDARATFLDGQYYIMYTALGDHGYRLGVARTADFEHVERIGLISEPDTKAGVLFPRRIDGRYARLERPASGGSIWITYSDDLIHWGDSELVMMPRGGHWDTSRIGAGPPPIEIDEGWLLIYYGVKDTSAGPIYRIGAALLDGERPQRVLKRSGIPILSPRQNYERLGDVPNLVFATGAYLDGDGTLYLFYGAANSCICIGVTSVSDILEQCVEV